MSALVHCGSHYLALSPPAPRSTRALRALLLWATLRRRKGKNVRVGSRLRSPRKMWSPTVRRSIEENLRIAHMYIRDNSGIDMV
ncbi:hypothetical protein EVAR_17399_1 [Eumeta japonica]|uniref:Uncharacterized protein n=1 Tax=Eumeta variegata TaxID=151549 RepID=A0A4C1V9J7_EUMVA|nr:hypothetical protein EVAR_17399_1 [Eumeta japonica]